uniref:S-formylglutathione hydrolase n=1 Tax=Anoplopoma fimbria TaxID=229290 RepID=C3KJV6_ANOFI|nr:S-formylglutathione hydrolase [Anoplopoma fimbria]
MALTQVSSNKCAGGFQKVFEHESTELKCKMKFAVFVPPKAETDKCPVMYWLSGLTCTEQNFITKAGSQVPAAEHGIIIVAPDTSPRGCNIEGEDENWDFGTGAGFYVNATEDPWKTNYRMYSYITEELPKLINANFPTDPEKMSISGHSMGGHGALICALKNPGKYKAVSAFAPSVTRCSVPGDRRPSQDTWAPTGPPGRRTMRRRWRRHTPVLSSTSSSIRAVTTSSCQPTSCCPTT